MRRSIAVVAVSLVFAAVSASAAFADNPHNPGITGQPNQSCETLQIDHNGFTTSNGFANAEDHYADPSILPPTANQTHTVSQYDVACFQQASHS
jgi:hypothetical protein